jgi:hypothetical protein
MLPALPLSTVLVLVVLSLVVLCLTVVGYGARPQARRIDADPWQAAGLRASLAGLRAQLTAIEPEGIYWCVGDARTHLTTYRVTVVAVTAEQYIVRHLATTYWLPRQELERAGQVLVGGRQFALGRYVAPVLQREVARWARRARAFGTT